jgi:hypothetical protein
MLQVDFGAVAYGAMWGYGVDPPSDTWGFKSLGTQPWHSGIGGRDPTRPRPLAISLTCDLPSLGDCVPVSYPGPSTHGMRTRHLMHRVRRVGYVALSRSM